MVIKMNKAKFIEKLKEKLTIEEKDAIVINDILENNNIIGKNNKQKIIIELMEKLEKNETEANKIYETSMQIITTAIKNKIKHPLKKKINKFYICFSFFLW